MEGDTTGAIGASPALRQFTDFLNSANLAGLAEKLVGCHRGGRARGPGWGSLLRGTVGFATPGSKSEPLIT